MTSLLKQRLIGAIVLISLGVIFIPMLLTGKGNILNGELESNVPPKPMYEIKAPAVLPLDKQNIAEPVLEPVKDKTKQQQVAVAKSVDKLPATETTVSKIDKPDSAKTTETENATPEKEVSAESTKPATTAKSTPKPAPKATTKPAASQVAKVQPATSKKPIVSGWVVQLGSFSVEKNAIKLRDRLRKKGHASFVEKFTRNGKTSYRVRVGPELHRETAEKLKEKLKVETKLNGLVLAFPDK